MVFTFELHDIDGDSASPMKRKPFELRKFKEVLEKYQKDLWGKGWNSLYLVSRSECDGIMGRTLTTTCSQANHVRLSSDNKSTQNLTYLV